MTIVYWKFGLSFKIWFHDCVFCRLNFSQHSMPILCTNYIHYSTFLGDFDDVLYLVIYKVVVLFLHEWKCIIGFFSWLVIGCFCVWPILGDFWVNCLFWFFHFHITTQMRLETLILIGFPHTLFRLLYYFWLVIFTRFSFVKQSLFCDGRYTTNHLLYLRVFRVYYSHAKCTHILGVKWHFCPHKSHTQITHTNHTHILWVDWHISTHNPHTNHTLFSTHMIVFIPLFNTYFNTPIWL